MTIASTFIFKAALSMVIASQVCCSQGNMTDAEFDRFCVERLDSAKLLTSEAAVLIEQNRNLTNEIKLCQTITSPSVPYNKFSAVLSDYQNARSLYLDHRQQYDLHVKEFHQQARPDNRALPPLAVPNLKPLAVAAEDACSQLQQFEQQLKSSETELCNMIQILQAEKGKIPEEAYFQKWLNTQTMATNVQSGALQFNRGVTTKGVDSSNRIHAATDAANVSGDYVQSKKVFSFVQTATEIENEETRRAHLHSTLASQCFIYINALNPNAPGADGSSTITADQLVKESNELQTEYEALQSKYSSMQNANPSHD
ncbi:MAG: hypothetical protein P4L53_29010 [Candidatus Obscuribacterales bacterium]|nr:hypothetical protein [Candidatus Obscuribacterales bacterium]